MGAPVGRDPLGPHSLSPQELKSVLVAERGGVPFLVYRDGEGTLQLHVLVEAEQPVILGRRTGVAVHLSWDQMISGVHAELRCLGGEWTIADDGLSRNGTFLNSSRVTARRRLRHGDRIRLGETMLVFNAAESTPTPETTLGREHPDASTLTDTQRRILVALCRPRLSEGEFHAPASNEQIANEVFLTVDAVKMQLRTMFNRFGLDQLPQNQKRAGLAEVALRDGLVTRRDL
jgi:pSer/pThr/pTyr-binding forkhead associated (FHA) protein